jgi:hypothetical protein
VLVKLRVRLLVLGAGVGSIVFMQDAFEANPAPPNAAPPPAAHRHRNEADALLLTGTVDRRDVIALGRRKGQECCCNHD